jgi:hypothetical protein
MLFFLLHSNQYKFTDISGKYTVSIFGVEDMQSKQHAGSADLMSPRLYAIISQKAVLYKV